MNFVSRAGQHAARLIHAECDNVVGFLVRRVEEAPAGSSAKKRGRLPPVGSQPKKVSRPLFSE